ncbi:hypothetical protein Tco_1337804 [Tanacetum coccineum]
MMVQAPEKVGEGSTGPNDSHPTTTQLSTSRPQKKQSRRKHRKDSGPTDPITNKATNKEHVSTPSYDPSQSGEDIMQLNELINICAKLSDRVLALENINTSQAAEIATLKERVKKLEKKRSTTAGEVVTTASVEIPEELTLAQTLIKIKSAKPKAVTTAATTVTPASSRPKAKGIVFHDQEEQAHASTPIVSPSQLPQTKDKGKAKMVELKKPLKKKDQIAIDEEVARNLEAQLQAELEEEERLSRQKEEESNIALIESWDNTQAMMDEMFDKEMKRVNTFVDMDTELVKGSKTKAEGSFKRDGEELEYDNSKKQRIDEHVEVKGDDDQEEAEIKKHMEIV